MNRNVVVLSALAAVALVVLSFFFLIKPKMDEVADLDAEADSIRTQQSQVESQIAALEEVRANAPDIEGDLATIGAIVTDSPSLPAVLRQLQLAADESGVTLVSVAPGRPSAVNVAGVPNLAQMGLTMSMEGGYFQVVDFLRRLEDPRITARGIVLGSVAVSIGEYPTLSVNVNGQMFALLENPPSNVDGAPAQPTEPEGDGDEADGETEGETGEEEAA